MRKNKAILLFVLLVAVLSVLPAASSVISRPAATVNLIRNHMISEAELETEYQNYVNMGAQGITRMDVLNTLINNEVFLQGAERDGITVSDRQLDQLYAQARANASAQAGRTVTDEEFAAEATRQFGSVDAYRQALREQYIVNQYVLMSKGAELQNIPMPTDAEISSFYRQNQQAFFQAENVKLAHIYIPKTGDAAEDQASRELLEKVASDIHSGAITFERAVSEYSQDNSSKNIGGDIGWLTADNTTARQGWGDAFCDAVLSMQPGDVSDVMVPCKVPRFTPLSHQTKHSCTLFLGRERELEKAHVKRIGCKGDVRQVYPVLSVVIRLEMFFNLTKLVRAERSERAVEFVDRYVSYAVTGHPGKR